MPKKNSINTDVTNNADGFDISGGTTARKLTVSGGDVNMVGGGAAVITYPSASGTLATLALEENIPHSIDVVLSADGKYSGITVAGDAGATLAFGDLCYLDTSVPEWKLTDANAAATAGTPKLGMCVLAADAFEATTILIFGSIRADAKFPTFNAGQLFISETAGLVTNTAPTTTDSVTRVIGHALTGDAMFFNPDNSYSTHV
jgi:hypothetical protein